MVLEPGADSGWHTHPGIALDVVKAGTVTAYINDGKCEPTKVEAGQAFLFPAGVTHIARNEGKEPAEIYVTYLVTAGADPRKDAEAPAIVEIDIMPDGAPAKLAEAATRALGPIDILVNSAGGSNPPLPIDAPEERWQEAMTLNFTRLRQLTHALLPGMIERIKVHRRALATRRSVAVAEFV